MVDLKTRQLPGLCQIPLVNQQSIERDYNWHTNEEKSAVKNLENRLKKALDRIVVTEALLNVAESLSNARYTVICERNLTLQIAEKRIEYYRDLLQSN